MAGIAAAKTLFNYLTKLKITSSHHHQALHEGTEKKPPFPHSLVIQTLSTTLLHTPILSSFAFRAICLQRIEAVHVERGIRTSLTIMFNSETCVLRYRYALLVPLLRTCAQPGRDRKKSPVLTERFCWGLKQPEPSGDGNIYPLCPHIPNCAVSHRCCAA